MKRPLKFALLVPAVLSVAFAQASGDRSKAEFDAASIHVNPPRVGLHFAPDSSSGGPDSASPGMFRCSNCTLATLIGKAFDLRNYQFPGRASLGNSTFDVMAKIPPGATQDEFLAMLQNLLIERFGLAYHYGEKTFHGYHLVVARNGAKLKESTDNQRAPATAHTHNGLMAYGGSATYRADHQTTADMARLVSDQLGLPVDDQTGLQGRYDISLAWAGANAHSGNHPEGAWGGGHTDHGDAPAAGSDSNTHDAAGLTLFQALQSQLGLRLIPSAQTVARVFVIDHVDQSPTAN